MREWMAARPMTCPDVASPGESPVRTGALRIRPFLDTEGRDRGSCAGEPAMARIPEVLGRHPLFRGLPREDMDPLARDCRFRTAPKGARLFSIGEPAASFFILVAGGVKLSTATPAGKEHVVEIVRAGESFALVPLLEEGGAYPENATALGAIRMVGIPRWTFHRLLARRPEVMARAIGEIAGRLRRLTARLEEVTTRSVQARVAAHLLRLVESESGAALPGSVVDLGTTRDVAACVLGTVREVLTRNLRSMERQGVLVLRGRRIELRDPAGLRTMSGN